MTGERLRQADIVYDEIVHSTMERAVQTAQIIHDSLPNVPLRADDMLVEGGPVPPVPTVTYWQLPPKVHYETVLLEYSMSRLQTLLYSVA